MGGGRSGTLLTNKALMTLINFNKLNKHVDLIASGGIMTPQNAKDRFTHGAVAVQLYTGLVFNGPALIKNIITMHLQST